MRPFGWKSPRFEREREKKKGFRCEKFQKFGRHLASKFQFFWKIIIVGAFGGKIWGLSVRLWKNMGSLGEGDAKNGGVLALHKCHLLNGSAPSIEDSIFYFPYWKWTHACRSQNVILTCHWKMKFYKLWMNVCRQNYMYVSIISFYSVH